MKSLRVKPEGNAVIPSARITSVATRSGKPHIVIIVENMPVPADRRVWQQATALVDNGWRVSVICPKSAAHPQSREVLEGVEIHRHSLPCEANGIMGYIAEYSAALMMETLALLRIGLGKIDIVQICNPPDFLFVPALMAKWAGGAKIIFDHHDLTPELLAEKTGKDNGALMQFARWSEKQTFRVASKIISTNTTFAKLAKNRGGKSDQDVNVVYSAPDMNRMPRVQTNSALKKGKDKLILWIGMIGSQDGVDLLLEAIRILKFDMKYSDFHVLIAGDGPEREKLIQYAHETDIAAHISFPGFLSGHAFFEALSTADIGVGSDPKNDFNDRLAMNKVMEYMAYGLPIAMFDLAECRKIAGDAALVAQGNDPVSLAGKLKTLLDDEPLRLRLGQAGYNRLTEYYAWEKQKEIYLRTCLQVLEAAA